METIESRELHEECGVVGFYGVDHAAAHAFLALQALQHRGQQGCGIAALGPDGSIGLHKGAGLVKDVFGKEEIASLPGSACIGHVRYPTTDVGGQENLQPFLFTRQGESFALAHNGNIVNAAQVKQFLERRGHLFHSTSDSELFACLVGTGTYGRDWEANICAATNLLDGAFATVLLIEGTLYACRDKYGFRPLSLGRLGSGYVIASETCALEAVGAVFERDIEPGELVAIDRNGVHSSFIARNCSRCMCAMEYIYFARPDSVIEGCSVHAFRRLSGRLLQAAHPAEADLVTCVPESSMSAAIGYAEASGFPLEMGLLKNMYVARTFIQPTQSLRDVGVKMKLSPVRSIVRGKRVAVIDDSIVRGTTSRIIVQMLRDAGATAVHMRIASPPYAWPCFYGIDTGTKEQLLASGRSVEEIREYIGADTLEYLPVEALYKASGRDQLCTACFDGQYPTELYQEND
ncbi:MAG: amidophosphoribosyltransferase [Bacteroidales bacterium]|nr:amidophosphoribosyltransferase [Bacteroidales bacterium]